MSDEAFEWRPADGDVAGRGRARYAHWDGSQRLGDIDADELLDALSEDVMSDGDLDDALRRAIEEGMPGRKGEQGLPGLRDLLAPGDKARVILSGFLNDERPVVERDLLSTGLNPLDWRASEEWGSVMTARLQ